MTAALGSYDDKDIILNLTGEHFDFSQFQSDGDDIRFYDQEGNQIPYRLYYWNLSMSKATIGLRPARNSSPTDHVVMYWGNGSAINNESTLNTITGINDPSVVLNAPLYAVTSNFTTSDTYGHTAAISNVSWTSKGLRFNGMNSVVRVNDGDLFSAGNGTSDRPFSLELWATPNSFATGDNDLIAKISNGTYWRREWQLTALPNGYVYFALWDSDGGEGVSKRIGRITLVNELLLNKTVLLHVTYDGSGSANGIQIFKDTVRIDNSNFNTGNYTATENLDGNVEIGSGFSPNYNFDGVIGGVRIYDHALTLSEIEQRFREERWKYVDTPYIRLVNSSTIIADGAVNGWGDLLLLRNGALLAAHTTNYTVSNAKISRDGGITRGEQFKIQAGSTTRLQQTANGTILATANTGTGANLATSDDSGLTWTSLPAIKSSIFPIANVLSRIIELNNGSLMAAVGETTDPWKPNAQVSNSVATSSTGGLSWENELVTANGTADSTIYDESNMTLLKNRDVLQAIRHNANKPYFYLTTFNGTAWSAPLYSRLPGTSTAMLLTLSSGDIIAQVRRYDPTASDALGYSLLYYGNSAGTAWSLMDRADHLDRLARDGGLVEFDNHDIGVALWVDNYPAVNGYFNRFDLIYPSSFLALMPTVTDEAAKKVTDATKERHVWSKETLVFIGVGITMLIAVLLLLSLNFRKSKS